MEVGCLSGRMPCFGRGVEDLGRGHWALNGMGTLGCSHGGLYLT